VERSGLLKWIDFTSSQTIEEAVNLLSEKNARLLAGGTDLIVLLRTNPARIGDPEVVVDVKEIPELNQLSYDSDSGLTLGAAVPCYKIYSNDVISKAYPGLIDAASLIGGIQIQGRASIGGNLCNATPSADSIPALIALSATCKIAGPGGTRDVPVEEFCVGPSKTVLESGELLVSLHFPPPPPNSGARYIRFIPRNEMDIAVAGAGVSVVLENGGVKAARVALSSVGPTPLFVKEAGESLVGKPPSDENIKIASGIARDAAKPISDMRGTVEFRTHLCEVLTRRALDTAIERANGGSANAH
jgi:carbon-monoxide dehydrogenase medium subunit